MTQAAELAIDSDIGTEECLDLAASAGSGHLAVVSDDDVNIFPVAVDLDGRKLMVSVPDAAALDLISQRRVGLAVERVDPLTQDAWSIVVHGVAIDLTDAIDATPQGGQLRLEASPFPQQSGPTALLIPSCITGHRFSALRPPQPLRSLPCRRGDEWGRRIRPPVLAS